VGGVSEYDCACRFFGIDDSTDVTVAMRRIAIRMHQIATAPRCNEPSAEVLAERERCFTLVRDWARDGASMESWRQCLREIRDGVK
jgi:hypothetical protein